MALVVVLLIAGYVVALVGEPPRSALDPGVDPPRAAAAARPPSVAATPPTASPSVTASPGGGIGAAPRISYPETGSRQWDVAPGDGPVAGHAGALLRYRVVVEREIDGTTPADVAREMDAALADRRGWTGGGNWRLRRVGPGRSYDFTIYLATPATRQLMCAYAPDRYTSCRNGDSVVVNVARWVHGVPDYGASLAVYRQYVVNHEVGHRLGRGHERCPGRGRLAPVMQQQTLGRHGCVANAWPYPKGDGAQYTGPPGSY